ncbi:UDP glucuronosyltransferase 5 family, polypeptide G2 [Coregonus clupeaformis]|uniref:UDP glucuronosyltransferase 5 family, polypeptide G2 n=1 Tax=Coregonus clupeaformis TaxID=59861 RepID=UPI001BE050F9|nr:UDP glucuronosyltransferase 5 family, polypeptide G2 [Coregonus clupeaformis]
MEVLVKELHGRGHQMTVIRQADSWFIRERSPHYTSVTVKLGVTAFDLNFFEQAMRNVLEGRRKGWVVGNLVQIRELVSILRAAHSATRTMLSIMLEDWALMAELKDSSFDLMLTDPGIPAGIILAHFLNLPMVYNVRWMSFGEGHFSIAPSPISYVPVPGSGLTDNMGFLQRTQNLIHYIINLLQERLLVLPIYSDILDQHFPPGTDLLAMQQSADMWLMRVDFVFEFPRPTMPNVAYIGGFQCRPAKPLPGKLEAFMQSSGEHGVVVMSLGTLISALPEEVTEAVAAAFAQLPQKVVWKLMGKIPSSLGNNTLLLDWLPQNDLLGHPKTRAFVVHGGTNSVYEAIYHGVPVLGLPLLFDQQDNLVRLQARGAAQVLDAATLTEWEFLEALQDILKNPSYQRSMKRLSSLHRDQPLHPLDRAAFWVEYVIRNKGASHLRTEAYSMPWYSYYSLDVVALLLTIPLGSVGALFSFVRVLLKRRSKKTMPHPGNTKIENRHEPDSKRAGNTPQQDKKKTEKMSHADRKKTEKTQTVKSKGK